MIRWNINVSEADKTEFEITLAQLEIFLLSSSSTTCLFKFFFVMY